MEENKHQLPTEEAPPSLMPYPLPKVPASAVKHVAFKDWDFFFTSQMLLNSKQTGDVQEYLGL
jgi:hypothetical protein